MGRKDEEISKRKGIIKYEDLLIVPYNHWKNDLEWLFFIVGKDDMPMLVPGYSVKLDEGLHEAVKIYRKHMELEDGTT